MLAYGKCGHSEYGCTCQVFELDTELTDRKHREAFKEAERWFSEEGAAYLDELMRGK